MNRKRVIGIILIIVGIVAIFFVNFEKGRVSSAKKDISEGSSLFGSTPMGKEAGSFMEGSMMKKASQYDQPLMWIQVGGIALIVVGAGMAIFCRK
jgi:hypothetical protein